MRGAGFAPGAPAASVSATRLAISRNAFACGLSGMLATTGRPVIGIGADDDVERHFAEEGNAEFLSLLARAPVREDVRPPAAMRT